MDPVEHLALAKLIPGEDERYDFYRLETIYYSGKKYVHVFCQVKEIFAEKTPAFLIEDNISGIIVFKPIFWKFYENFNLRLKKVWMYAWGIHKICLITEILLYQIIEIKRN